MQVTETHSEGLKREYKIRLDKDEIDQKVQDRLKEVGQQARIPGFRPGKVPMSILRKRFGQAVMGEVLEKAVSDSLQHTLEERGLRPVQQPEVEIESFDEGTDLEYRTSMELLPDIEPMDFSQVSLERLKITVPDKEVDQAVERLAQHHKESQPVEEPRPAATGDILVIDFKGAVDGEELPGMSGEDHHLELGSNRFIEGFEDQLVGAEVGETRQIRVTFPKTYQNDKLAGREADFEVTVKEIREAAPVAIDDALAEKLGEENLEGLKARVREHIENDYEEMARTRLKRELLDKLSDGHDFEVPASMVDQEFDQIWHQIEHDREEGNLDPEDADKDEAQLKEEYRRIAERRVRLGLLLSEIGRRANIEVTQDELNQKLVQELQRDPQNASKILDYYQNNPQAQAQLRAPIYEDKAIDYILELADVQEREITTDQFREELEAMSGAGEAGEATEADASGAAGKATSGKATSGKSDGKTAKAESKGASDQAGEGESQA